MTMQPMNRPGAPRRRTQHQSVPQSAPVIPSAVQHQPVMQPVQYFPPVPPPVQPAPPAPQKKKRRRFSLIRTLLMLIGLGTVLVMLARYVIVPVLVMLPQWLGGAV